MKSQDNTSKDELIFIVTNDNTGRSYEVTGGPNCTKDLVWMSERVWFMPGTPVTIRDPEGNSKTYKREV